MYKENLFDKWNIKKKAVNKEFDKIFNEGQIWYLSLGKNIGFEQDGKGDNFSRPVLIIKKFNKNIFYGVPLTSKIKDNKFYFSFDGKTGIKSCAILSQMKLFDSKRLENRIGSISFRNMRILKEKIKKLIF